MIRSALLGVALATTALASVSASAQTPPAAPANRGYDVAVTTIGTLVDDPDSRAILERHLPGITTFPQLDQARGFTLKVAQSFAPDLLTDDILAAIQADLSALPPKP